MATTPSCFTFCTCQSPTTSEAEELRPNTAEPPAKVAVGPVVLLGRPVLGAPKESVLQGSNVENNERMASETELSYKSEPGELGEEHPLARSVRLCRIVEAGLELEKLLQSQEGAETARRILGDQMVDQVLRTAERYKGSLEIIRTLPADLQIYSQSAPLKLAGGFVDALLRYLSLYVDKDTTVGWDPEMKSARALGVQRPTEAMWQTIKVDALGVKLDDVTIMSWLLAPDESVGDIWISESSQNCDLVMREQNSSLPPPADGHARSTDISKYTTLTVLRDTGDASKPLGLRVKLVMDINPGSLTTKIMKLLPSWGLRRAIGGPLEGGIRSTPAYVKLKEAMLDQHVKSGPSAPFYDCVRRHISG
eukprot:CAMPEP_0115153540 /NCGR_PEP_ID=MMETSP0227-20121206/66786_1 /TAXON_ID=89957 /ORGANISM="Polarella glacialis, Strain CCMP 1383" /LENGTH=364 /DNA_ID=CAMNT_0002564297 /DNA_START=84 /DNA_END=1179 /DNA_ORIENTATION=+